ncbi:MAG: hypothetical protein NWE95_13060 [Candidatus Bathyarchaeota archaeon]|jgi:hypothetical protein|nr:hypothetical protein [Candidatus Bathyarchaeota archaeon]
MSKKTIITVTIVIVLLITTGVLLHQQVALTKSNHELLELLEKTNSELEVLKRNYSDLLNLFGANANGELSPKIETRLGIKLMEGQRNANYLWVTGEVENVGDLTLFNVRLRYTLHTSNGTDVKEDIIGTLQPHQIVTRRFTAWTSLGKITSWELEPVATYQP